MTVEAPDLSKPVPIEAFFGTKGTDRNEKWDVLGSIQAAQLIIGVDVMSRHEFLLYGRQILEKIAKNGTKPALRVIRIELDQASDELEKATAMVHLVRGRCDYQGFVND